MTTAGDIFNPDIWLDADALVGSDNTDVGTFSDQSGNGHDFTQGTAANKPHLRLLQWNGKKCLRFGGNQQVSSGAISAFDNIDEITWLFVCTGMCPIAATGCRIMNWSASDSTSFGGVYAQTSDGTATGTPEWNHYVRNNAGSFSQVDDDWQAGPVILTGRWDSDNTFNMWTNGSSKQSISSIDGTAGTHNSFRLGQDISGSNKLVGDIYEAIFYSSSLSDANRASVEAYLSEKYNIPIQANPVDSVIAGYDSKNNSFPHIAEDGSGNYYVVYRVGTSHETDKGSIYYRKSTDSGATWGTAAVVNTDATLDSRDPAITILANGDLAVEFTLYDHVGESWSGNAGQIVISDDGGATWGTPFDVDNGFTDYGKGFSTIIELATSEWVVASFGEDTSDSYESVEILYTDNAGTTWTRRDLLLDGETDTKRYIEPQLLRLSGGDLLIAIRNETDRQIMTATSSDDGVSWTTPTNRFSGYGKPSITELTNGKIMCIYRAETAQPIDEFAAYRLSEDGGVTWGDEVVFLALAGISGFDRMTYAGAVALSGGDAFAVVSIEQGDANALLTGYIMDFEAATLPLIIDGGMLRGGFQNLSGGM